MADNKTAAFTSLLKSYIEMYSKVTSSKRVTDFDDIRFIAKKVIVALNSANVKYLMERASVPLVLLANENLRPLDAWDEPNPDSDSAIINIDHPGYIIYTLIKKTMQNFSIYEHDSEDSFSDIDDSIFLTFVNASFESITGRGSGKRGLDELLKRSNLPADIEKLIVKLPKDYFMANTKLEDEIVRGKNDSSEYSVAVKKKNSGKPIVTKAILSFPSDHVSVKSFGRSKHTPYDRAVLSGIMSLYEAKNMTFTPAMVYRAMNGLSDSEYISPDTLAKVERSIDKSRKSLITIDFTDEAELYVAQNLIQSKNLSSTYEGYLLPAEKIALSNNGIVMSGYRLLSKPILYQYAQIVNQVISVPIDLLQTRSSVRSTDEVIVIREFLLRRIENFKRRKKAGTLTILYSDIYDLSGISQETHKNYRDKCLKLRHHTEAVLNEWIQKEYISSYINIKERRGQITSVEITI